jgi:hypothetical protein
LADFVAAPEPFVASLASAPSVLAACFSARLAAQYAFIRSAHQWVQETQLLLADFPDSGVGVESGA